MSTLSDHVDPRLLGISQLDDELDVQRETHGGWCHAVAGDTAAAVASR
jgi:hypothetical protein